MYNILSDYIKEPFAPVVVNRNAKNASIICREKGPGEGEKEIIGSH